jgi:hypothetical protein
MAIVFHLDARLPDVPSSHRVNLDPGDGNQPEVWRPAPLDNLPT